MKKIERVRGIEPLAYPWEGYILPLYYTRITRQLMQLAREILFESWCSCGCASSSGLGFEFSKRIMH